MEATTWDKKSFQSLMLWETTSFTRCEMGKPDGKTVEVIQRLRKWTHNKRTNALKIFIFQLEKNKW